ncbi:hypothetical protein [Microbulbifer sp. JMSA008]|uniref:hypothetical protein n=1 Tax=Microbulbifer sp. JMSA008 TaxID=3243373 RepID=UPI00403A6F5E
MATVFIWNNNLVSSKVGRGHEVIGHASLNIVDEWVNYGVNNDTFYVSWWPAQGGGGLAGDSFLEDIRDEEGYAPDHVIRIPKNKLDTLSMLAKWQEIRNKPGASYKFVKKNCSTIASRVLKAGSNKGGSSRHKPVWTPLCVKRLAYAMGGVDMNWVEFVMELKGSISAESLEQLKTVKRRSSRHGHALAAPPRFNKGNDTGKIDPNSLFNI